MVTAKILWHYISTFMSPPSNHAGFHGVSGAKAAKFAEIWQRWVKKAKDWATKTPAAESEVEAFLQKHKVKA